MMKNLQLDTYPLDDTPFKPTKCFFFHCASGLSSETRIQDITSHVDIEAYNDLTSTFLDIASKAAKSVQDATYTAHRTSRFPVTEQSITNAHNEKICTITTNLLKLSGRKIVFDSKFPLISHDLELKTTSIGGGTEYFVVNSELYFWESDGAKHRMVHKVVEGKRVLVAEYGARHGWSSDGVLVVDTGKIEEVVAVVTAFVIITRNDSWTK